MFLEEQFTSDSKISRANALRSKPKDSNDVVSFVVTYDPAHSSTRCKAWVIPFGKIQIVRLYRITWSRVIFRETSQETKNKCYCKKKNRPQFSTVYFLSGY